VGYLARSRNRIQFSPCSKLRMFRCICKLVEQKLLLSQIFRASAPTSLDSAVETEEASTLGTAGLAPLLAEMILFMPLSVRQRLWLQSSMQLLVCRVSRARGGSRG
jgi:hypothetical protein